LFVSITGNKLLIAKNGICPYKVFILLTVVAPWNLPPGAAAPLARWKLRIFPWEPEGDWVGRGADSEEVYNLFSISKIML